VPRQRLKQISAGGRTRHVQPLLLQHKRSRCDTQPGAACLEFACYMAMLASESLPFDALCCCLR
jgi:hypothetical protein